LQAAGLISGAALAIMPAFILNANWTNTIVSLMEYILVVGLILAIVGVLLRGPIGQRSALKLVIASSFLGVWMVLAIFYVQFLTMVFLNEDWGCL